MSRSIGKKGWIFFFMSALIGTVGITYTMTTNAVSANIIIGSYYKIINANSGMVLGIIDMSKDDGGAVIQWPDTGTTDHNWQIISNGSYYKFKNQNSGKFLGFTDMSKEDGANVIQCSDNGKDDQDWTLAPLSNGRYKIVNRYSNKVLGVTGNSKSNGAMISQRTDNGALNHEWILVPVSIPNPITSSANGTLSRVENQSGTKINSTFWNPRIKSIITNWIPHCYKMLSDVNLTEGGIQNFVMAGQKNNGKNYSAHGGYPWSDAYVLNTLEAMCNACMIDPQGDNSIANSQAEMKAKINEWVPIILSAQEADGYFQTYINLNNLGRWEAPRNGYHEGYVAGYFLEAAIAYTEMNNRNDLKMYNAAKKLANCWAANKPGQGMFWDEHEEIEQAMCRFGNYVNDIENSKAGNSYINCAKSIMDCRTGGNDYSQSLTYPAKQTSAVGYAVRGVYLYSGMINVGALLNNPTYTNAATSIWDNIVNKKMYITGGLGSTDSGEAFGKDYELPNDTAYCESCAGCGNVFFNNDMNIYYKDGKYADVMQQALYNNVLGSLTLDGSLFTYTNPLDSSTARYKWHNCPCCIGNIARTILSLQRFTYNKTNNAIYVNMYVGSTMKVSGISGTDVEMVQTTNYPWENNVNITVNPVKSAEFTIYLHSPDRSVSACYTNTPNADGINSITVNGIAVNNKASNGYVAITRTWKAGDEIALNVPLVPQRIKAVNDVSDDAGKVAVQYGPLVYNAESVDNNGADISSKILKSSAELTAKWNPGLLDGVMTINGKFEDGSAMTLIPNYARLNRGGRSIVWLKD